MQDLRASREETAVRWTYQPKYPEGKLSQSSDFNNNAPLRSNLLTNPSTFAWNCGHVFANKTLFRVALPFSGERAGPKILRGETWHLLRSKPVQLQGFCNSERMPLLLSTLDDPAASLFHRL